MYLLQLYIRTFVANNSMTCFQTMFKIRTHDHRDTINPIQPLNFLITCKVDLPALESLSLNMCSVFEIFILSALLFTIYLYTFIIYSVCEC